MVVIGTGAAGLVAALAAAKSYRVLLLEKAQSTEAEDASNTARSTGLIPAAGTWLQRAAGVHDDAPELLAQDILRENGDCDAPLVRRVVAAAGSTVEWLASILPHGALLCTTDFLYPGHCRLRMHGPASGYGRRLHEELLAAAQAHPNVEVRRGVDVGGLQANHDNEPVTVRGVFLSDGSLINAAAVVLATNGFGANRSMVSKYMGEAVAQGLYLGSPLNNGEGILWAARAGASLERMGSYQGHATVVAPSGPLVTWGVVVNGGVLVDRQGERFGNELVGYSAYSERVMTLPDAEAIEIFPAASFEACRGTRFEEVVDAGQVGTFASLSTLCDAHGIPPKALAATLEALRAAAGKQDRFGRAWPAEGPWQEWEAGGPLHAIRVRAALFHTQGGVLTDTAGRVLRAGAGEGEVGAETIAGLYAAGGVCAGLSGSGARGYLSGNGLLHAVVSGRWAGEAAGEAAAAAAAADADGRGGRGGRQAARL